MSKLPKEPPSSEITPHALYPKRREFIKNGVYAFGTAAAMGGGLLYLVGKSPPPDSPDVPAIAQAAGESPYAYVENHTYDIDETPNSYKDITTYNNFYEFGLDKSDPARNASTLRPRPWTITVEGEVAKPQTLDIDTLLTTF